MAGLFPAQELEDQGYGYAGDGGGHVGGFLWFDALVGEGVDGDEGEGGVVPALELLPAGGAQTAQGEVVGCGDERDDRPDNDDRYRLKRSL